MRSYLKNKNRSYIKTKGQEKTYTIIADGEYEAAEKYKHIIADFPEVEEVMNDETFHGDAVMKLIGQ